MSSFRRLQEIAAEAGLRTADLVGKRDVVLDNFLSSDDFYMPVDESFRHADRVDDPDGRVVFPVVQGREGVGSSPYLMCVFAHAFRTNGYEPLLPLCGCDLSACFEKPHDGRDYFYCNRCEYSGRTLFDEFNLNPNPLSEYIDEPTVDNMTNIRSVDTYRDVPVSDLALASTRRSLLRYNVDLENPEHRSIYLGFLESAMLLTDVAHALFDEHDIVATVAWDASYVYGGPFMYVADARNTPAYQCGAGYSDGTLMFGRPSNVSPMPAFTDSTVIERFLDRPLSDDQRADIDGILRERTEGANDVPDPISAASESIDRTGYDRVFGLFTNLLWDASLEGRNIVFDSPLDWVETTVQHFRDEEDTLLVIKTHPAEAVFGTAEPVREWVYENLSPVPENVRILEPDTSISPYTLAHDLDIGIVYNSTIGLEMACRGIPVVVAGETHYRRFAFTFDAESIPEYEQWLTNSDQLSMTDEQQTRARRYAYLFFVVEQLPFPELFYGEGNEPVTHEDVKERQEYQTVVESNLADEPVVRPEFRSLLGSG